MSNPDPKLQVEAWLRQGIDAARSGDQSAARALLEQVVVQDQRNERGWFWLAAVVDSIEQKRICLGNVLTINPNNEQARNLLDKLQAIAAGQPVETFMPPGATTGPAAVETGESAGAEFSFDTPVAAGRPAEPRSSRGDGNQHIWYIAAIVGTVATVILIIILVMMLMGGDDDDGGDSGSNMPVATIASANLPTPVSGDVVLTEQPSMPTAPPAADVTATPTIPATSPLPTWTPVPSITPTSAVAETLFQQAPASIGGKIIMRSGNVPGDTNNQPIAVVSPDGTNQQIITIDQRGHTPVLSPDGSRMAYIKYSPGMREYLMEFDNLQGTAPRSGADYWGRIVTLIDPDQPAWSFDGGWLVFTATGMGSVTADLYLLDLSDAPTGDVIRRLTEDGGIAAWPAFAPDGVQIVYAVDRSSLELGAGTDLQVYNIPDGNVRTLTTNGPTLTESAPDWSPDGTQIVFAAQESGRPETDIYLISALGGAEPLKIIDSDSNDIQPRFSPDGQYIVFSSDRTGNWDVFIYEIATQSYYQVTTSRDIDIANDWGR